MSPRLLIAFVLTISFASALAGADAKDDKLDGTWLPARAEPAKLLPDELLKTMKLVIKGDQYTVTVGEKMDQGTLKLMPGATPKAMDITGVEGPNKGKTILAIYERKGDTLRICYDLGGKDRPKEFKAKERMPLLLVEYKLQK